MERQLVEEPERLRRALSPLRRQLLTRLRTPASAAELAAELDVPRQRLGYHLRLLEEAGLIELAEQRRRGGFVERVLRTTADAFVVDPGVLEGAAGTTTRAEASDRHAARHLVDVAGRTVRDVARMQSAAEQAGTRLLTFTVETEVRFESPADMHRFTEALAGVLADVVRAFDTPGGRPYRVVAAGHPAPRAEEKP